MQNKTRRIADSDSEEEAGLQNQEDGKEFHPIDELQEHGISKNDVTKLSDAGFKSVEAVSYAPKKALAAIKGFNDLKAEKLMAACAEMLDLGFKNSKVLLMERKRLVRISSGSKALDEILGGGFEGGSITEIYGEYRTGKTQLCHTLCVTCQLPRENGGGGGKAIYIDTEGTFRPEKLEPIAARFGLDKEQVISNVCYARAYNSDHQHQLLFGACGLMAEDHYSLLIVDSATALFRTDFQGRGELSSRQMSLAKFLRNLQKIADEHKCVVVVTNQVVASVDGSAFAGANDKKPIGGHIMAHACQTRLALKKMKGNNRQCRVCDAPNLPELDAEFSITEAGIDEPM